MSMATLQAAPRARRSTLWFFTAAASILVGIVPIWVLENWFGVPRKISVGYGIIAYVIGTTALKLPLHHFVVERTLRPRLASSSLATAHGALSALSELVPASVFFVYVVPHLTWWQLVGFGVGAGAVEAIMLPFLANPLKGTSLEEHASEVFRRSAMNPVVQWLSVLERVWAMLLQVSTRGLVGLSVYSGDAVPACLAVVGFGAVDGTAYYGHLKKWRFDTVPLLARVHLFLGAAAVLMTAVFLWWSALVWPGAG
jgi:hypothetical protein